MNFGTVIFRDELVANLTALGDVKDQIVCAVLAVVSNMRRAASTATLLSPRDDGDCADHFRPGTC